MVRKDTHQYEAEEVAHFYQHGPVKAERDEDEEPERETSQKNSLRTAPGRLVAWAVPHVKKGLSNMAASNAPGGALHNLGRNVMDMDTRIEPPSFMMGGGSMGLPPSMMGGGSGGMPSWMTGGKAPWESSPPKRKRKSEYRYVRVKKRSKRR
jgi:hypothetical protein